MRFRKALSTLFLCTAALTTVSIYGCGRKPERQLPNRALQYFSENAGCLNDFGPKASRYLQGDISEPEWSASCGCTIESLRLFQRYIRGTPENGYTPEDIRAFVGRFLITDREVRLELVRSIFEFKASLLGGDAAVLTRAELQKLVDILESARRSSQSLLPHLYRLAREPSSQELLDFADALTLALRMVAENLRSEGYPAFDRAAGDRLLSELAILFRWENPAEFTLWTGALKGVLIGGSADSIEGAEWAKTVEVAGRLGGPMIALLALDLGSKRLDRAVLAKLLDNAKSVLLERLHEQGGSVSYERLDLLADRLPSSIRKRVDAGIIKRTLRPLLHKILATKTDDSIDEGSIELLFSQLHLWNRKEGHLESIFDRLPDDALKEGATPEEFQTAAEKYARDIGRRPGSQDDLKQIGELIGLASRYRPLFIGDDPQVTFIPTDRIGKFHLSQLNWISIAIENLLRAYGTGRKVSPEQFKEFFADFTEVAAALGIIDTTVPEFQLKRFREANLFTFSGNGDDFVDADEALYLVSYLNSSGVLTAKTTKLLKERCASLGDDHMGGVFYELGCMREAYYSDVDALWDHFPGLLKHYKGLDAKKKLEFQRSLEMASRPFGLSDKPVNTSDIQGFSTIPHYVEGLLLRIDENGDQHLDLAEARKALPIFKKFLAELANADPKDEGMLEAVFTYTIKFSHPPRKTVGGISHFLWWRATKAFWKLNADRSAIYATIGALNDPKAAEQDPE